MVYAEVMLPERAPPEYVDRNVLWNSVEWSETKRDAQLARTVELALPAELTHEQNIALIRRFVQKTFVDKGMCAEVAFHDNAKFYDLRSRRKENAELSSAIGARIHAYEDRKKYQRYYSAWSKLSGNKASAYEREHQFELHKYRQADRALNRREADGERIQALPKEFITGCRSITSDTILILSSSQLYQNML